MKLGEVDIWSFSLQQPVCKLSELSRLLSDEEHIRADQFYFEELKRCYIVRHAFKRLILADYLGEKPQDLCFYSTGNGKPNLVGTSLHFNLSSSADCAWHSPQKVVRMKY